MKKKEKRQERAKDSMPTGVTPPVTQEDTEMKDKPASSDGYEDLSGYEDEEKDEALVTPPPVTKKQAATCQAVELVGKQPPPTKIPPKSPPGPTFLTKAAVFHGVRARDP